MVRMADQICFGDAERPEMDTVMQRINTIGLGDRVAQRVFSTHADRPQVAPRAIVHSQQQQPAEPNESPLYDLLKRGIREAEINNRIKSESMKKFVVSTDGYVTLLIVLMSFSNSHRRVSLWKAIRGNRTRLRR